MEKLKNSVTSWATYTKIYSTHASIMVQLNLKFYGCRYNRSRGLSIQKTSLKSLKLAPFVKRYVSKFNAYQLMQIWKPNIKFHGIIFIRLGNVTRLKNTNFHPYSLKRENNSTCWAICTKIYYSIFQLGTKWKISWLSVKLKLRCAYPKNRI